MDNKNFIEQIIIGAGPAGLQIAYFLQKRRQDYLILEQNEQAGNFFSQYPRHRKLLSINKKYTGYTEREIQLRYDWNSLLDDEGKLMTSTYSDDYFPDASIMVNYCNDFYQRFNLKIAFKKNVVTIDKVDHCFIITTAMGEVYRCHRLFIATGLFKENLPDIKGIEYCQTYGSAPIDPQVYKNQRILIVGKGNSAFETADNLIAVSQKIQICGAKPVKLAWASHYVGDLRAVNNNFIDTYLLKAQNNILEGELQQVRKARDGLIASIYFDSRKRSYDFPCDQVILCTGFKFDTSIFAENCKPELTHCGRLPKMTSAWQTISGEQLYFIGTLMQMRDRKKTMSGFIHGFRHNIQALDQILDDSADWRDQCSLPYDAIKLCNHIMQRISCAAGIFLQPGFLGDLFWLQAEQNRILYWHAVPQQYAHDQHLIDNAVSVTLEYKSCDPNTNPLAMPRGIGITEDFYLHPVIRQYQQGKCVARYHLMDDLDNDWRILPEHRQKLLTIVALILTTEPSQSLQSTQNCTPSPNKLANNT